MPDRRWIALIALCLGVVMIVLDGTVVTVALPLIRADLGFSQAALVWVINAYILTFGGCLLLGGRLGDLYGARRVFLIGIVAFTFASLACGLATTQLEMIWARAVQGAGGAVVDAVSLALITNMFIETGERAKAMGIYGFIASAGATLGVLLGGFITSYLDWHWVFLVNIPFGVVVYALCLRLVPIAPAEHTTAGRLDLLGAVTLTGALMLAVYGIISGGEVGWFSSKSLATLAGVVLLLAAFIFVESRVSNPLMPLRVLRSRMLVVTNVTAALSAAAMFATFFLTLYLQRVLGKSPLQVSLIFLPTCLISAVLALGFSARIVNRYGIRRPFAAGLLLAALGLALLAGIPVQGDVLTDVFPGMTLFHDRRRGLRQSIVLVSDARGRTKGLRTRIRTGRHVVHDRRIVRTGNPRCLGGGVDPQPRSTGCRSNGCADRWLPRGLRHWCGVSCRVCSAGAAVAPRHYSTF